MTCNPVENSVLIWLEGPFAVVFNRDTSNKIIDVTAFSPFDPDHLCNITSPQTTPVPAGAFPNEYRFTLKGVVPANTICVSADFGPFCVNQMGMTTGNSDHSFVRLKLPRPTNVYTTNLVDGITAGAKPVCVPQDHLFEYQPSNGQSISLDDEDRGTSVSLSPNSILRLEVGLPKGNDPHGDHAKHFHNRSNPSLFSRHTSQCESTTR